jgi:hypothetical protein
VLSALIWPDWTELGSERLPLRLDPPPCHDVAMFALLSTLCAGLFTGAAGYVTLVAQPSRLEAGTEVALAEFRPSFPRARRLQASLALLGGITGTCAWLAGDGAAFLLAALLLFGNVGFTLVVIAPLYERLMDPALAAGSSEARPLLERWGRLHAVRSGVGLLAFLAALLGLRA